METTIYFNFIKNTSHFQESTFTLTHSDRMLSRLTSLANFFKYKHYEAAVRLFTNALLEYINQDDDFKFCLEEPLRKLSEKKEVAKQSKKDSEQKKEKPDYLILYNDVPLGGD